MFDAIVVGKGMFGAAAARYLNQHLKSVALIGPDEPTEPWTNHNGTNHNAANHNGANHNGANHTGVYASHYDQGRITRGLDSTKVWADLAIKSIAEYRAIEAASGIKFYHPCGCIQVGPPVQAKDPYMVNTEAVAQELGTNYKRYTGSEFRAVYPQLFVEDDYTVLHEPTLAGYVNPRQLVQAQVAIAAQQGTTVISETVTNFKRVAGRVQVETDGGQSIQAQRVLFATGAWTQFLLEQDLGMVLNPRTILLAKLSPAETERFQDIPSVIFYAGMKHPALTGIYMLPPIRYPDGHIYLKIGGRLKDMDIPESADELRDWFHSDGSAIETEALEHQLFSILPSLKAESLTSRPCVVTQTANKEPLITELDPGRVYICAGGCGAGAKSSNEIGRLAAQLVLQKVGQTVSLSP